MRIWGEFAVCIGLLALIVPSEAFAGPAPPPPPAPGPGQKQQKRAPPPPPPGPGPSSPRKPGAAGQPSPTGTPPAPGATKQAPPADPFVDEAAGGEGKDLTKSWGYSQSKELEPAFVDTGPTAPTATANPIGFYSGVSLEGENPPPIPPPAMGTTPAVVTFPGYEKSASGSRVFFQLSAGPEYQVAQEGLVIRVRMANTAVNVANNKRPLDLRYFKTPVKNVALRTEGADTVATITLKRESVPSTQLLPAPNGYRMLVLEFPAE